MVDFFGIHFAGIDRIIFLPIVVILFIVLIRNHRRVSRAAQILVHPQHRKTIFKHYSPLRQRLKLFLSITAITGVFIALLQPQWGKQEQQVVQEGRDLLIVLDISRSMLAKDFKPSRLDFAKLKIRTLLEKIPSERVGLIVFSGSAFVQCPLTADHAAFLMFLEHVDTQTISSGTTAIDQALVKTISLFENSPTRKNKLAMLLTDGEDFSYSLDSAQARAIKQNLHLFAIGIGSNEGAPIPKVNERGEQIGHEVDSSGAIALSKLDEGTLQKLCSSLNGHYVRATYDDTDIDAIVTDIKRFEKETFADKKMSLYHDQYPWFLAIAWICLALEWIL